MGPGGSNPSPTAMKRQLNTPQRLLRGVFFVF